MSTLKTQTKYKKQLSIFPVGFNRTEGNKKLCMLDWVLFDYDNTWRRIDEFAVIHGFDNYYDLYYHAYLQGDHKKLPFKFKWM
tara:strand:- start:1046 stop:1294 length:249 start_codon:yes stop_codon:yes gene_type:complete